MTKVYKYFSHDIMEVIFQKDEFCGIKCSLPKDYNDPYELFLGVDLGTSTDLLAFYSDIIQEIPQFPTTCFSKSPIVPTMWAHYARSLTGFVLEFDLEGLKNHFKDCSISDVTYRDEPSENLRELIEHAAVAKKFRHAHWLMNLTFNESYFSKYSEWSYEQECSFVCQKDITEDIDGNDILFIPCDFVTSMIVGSKCPHEKVKLSIELSEKNDLDWYELVIGKSQPKPYMKNQSEEVFIFANNQISEAEHICENCTEPLVKTGTLCCPWCSITEAHREEAAQNNPFRILDRAGQLEEYLKTVSKIEK